MSVPAPSLEVNQIRFDHFDMVPDPSAAGSLLCTPYYKAWSSTGWQYFKGTTFSVLEDGDPTTGISTGHNDFLTALTGAGYTLVSDPTNYSA